MSFIPVAPEISARLTPQHGAYYSLANRIIDAVVQGQSLVLVAGEPSPEGSLLRPALEIIESRLLVLEVPCASRFKCADIIKNLVRFALAENDDSGSGLFRARVRTLLVCESADALDDDELETIVRLAQGGDRRLAAVLLVSPRFALRLQNPELRRLNEGTPPCFRFDEFLKNSSAEESVGTCQGMADRVPPDAEASPSRRAQLSAAALAAGSASSPNNSDTTLNGTGSPQSAPKSRSEPNSGRIKMTKLGLRLTLAILFACVAGDVTVIFMGWRFGPANTGAAAEAARAGSGAIAAAQPSFPDSRTTNRPMTEVNPAAGGTGPAFLPTEASPGPKDGGAETATSPSTLAIPAPKPDPNPPAKQMHQEPAKIQPGAVKSLTERSAAEKRESIAAAESAPASTQKQVPAVEPPPPAKPGRSVTLAPAVVASLVERGERYLTTGDIASARLFFERAANAGDAQSALRMAQTFDPGFLASAGVRGVVGDKNEADFWFQRAQQLAGGPAPSLSPSSP